MNLKNTDEGAKKKMNQNIITQNGLLLFKDVKISQLLCSPELQLTNQVKKDLLLIRY